MHRIPGSFGSPDQVSGWIQQIEIPTSDCCLRLSARRLSEQRSSAQLHGLHPICSLVELNASPAFCLAQIEAMQVGRGSVSNLLSRYAQLVCFHWKGAMVGSEFCTLLEVLLRDKTCA